MDEDLTTALWEYHYLTGSHMEQIVYNISEFLACGWAPCGGPAIVVKPDGELYIVQVIARMQIPNDEH